MSFSFTTTLLPYFEVKISAIKENSTTHKQQQQLQVRLHSMVSPIKLEEHDSGKKSLNEISFSYIRNKKMLCYIYLEVKKIWVKTFRGISTKTSNSIIKTVIKITTNRKSNINKSRVERKNCYGKKRCDQKNGTKISA